MKELKHSHDELRDAVDEMQRKPDAVTARTDEAEGRISEKDKITKKDETEKKRDKKNKSYRHSSVHVFLWEERRQASCPSLRSGYPTSPLPSLSRFQCFYLFGDFSRLEAP